MQPVERVDKYFVVKLFVLFGLLYLGFAFRVPLFTKTAEAKDSQENYASPAETHEPKQIKKLYYYIVSEKAPDPEEVAI